MKKLLIFAVLTICLAITGCGSSDPMAGTWKLEVSEDMKKLMGDNSPTSTAVFKDGTVKLTMAMGTRTEELEGTYKLEGKTLTITPTKEGGKPSNDKPETITLADDMKSFDMPGGVKMVKQ